MSTIRPINSQSIHQICSGQVILDLATAVKELLENAIDAGATSIEVKLKDYGKTCIEVADNGQGVEESNYEGLTRKYHTSKLQDFSDLTSVGTFGFRGEALSSLCALSVMTITTRFKSAKVGHRLEYDHHGKITKKSCTARQQGTTVILKDIFQPLPVRHKEFEKNLKRDYSKLLTLLYSYCVVCTDIKISCSNELKGIKQEVFRTSGTMSTQDNITTLFGNKVCKSLVNFRQTPPTMEACENYNVNHSDCLKFNDSCNISGYISSCGPGLGRRSADMQFISINKRPCSLPKMTKLLNDIFHMFNKNQYPFIQIDISLDRNQVDINVTPDKRQVFLTHEKFIFAILKSSMLEIYNGMNHVIGSIKLQPTIQASFGHVESVKGRESAGKEASVIKRAESFLTKLQRLDSNPSISSNCPNSYFVNCAHIADETCSAQHCEDGDTDSEVCHGDAGEGNRVHIGIETESSITQKERKIACSDSLALSKFQDENIYAEDGENPSTPVLNMAVLSSFHHSSNRTNSNLSDKRVASSARPSNPITDYFRASSGRVSLDDVCDNTSLPNSSIEETSYQCDGGDANCATDIRESTDKALHGLRYSFKDMQRNWDLKQQIRHHISEQSVKTQSGMFKAKISSSENSQAEKELSKHFSRDCFKKMDVIGQFNLGFIIANYSNDLFIIDQHASDEKYNFESLQKSTKLKGQPLIVPQKLELTASDIIVLEDNIDIFVQNGFKFKIQEDISGQKSVLLLNVPSSQNWVFDSSDVSELLFVLRDSPHTLYRPTRIRQMFASRACRKSIMIGTSLTNDAMKHVLDHMSEMDQPWNCPHGRPTMRHLIDLSMIMHPKSVNAVPL